MAHEINQPLAAITASGEACLRWLNRAEPDLAEATELTRRMVADGRRAAEIITRVRRMAAGNATERAAAGRDPAGYRLIGPMDPTNS